MSNIIGIVNYGTAGNLHSVEKALKKASGKTLIINNVNQFNEVDKIVLPGVGSFKNAMKQLENIGFLQVLLNNTKPILGICLGMQILSTLGFEYGKTKGLGFIKGKVIPLTMNSKFNIGWHKLKINKTENRFIKKINNDATFYFCHSYYFNISQSNSKYSVATVSLDKEVPSIICKDNVLGVQFHPERSQNHGVNFIENFIENFQ